MLREQGAGSGPSPGHGQALGAAAGDGAMPRDHQGTRQRGAALPPPPLHRVPHSITGTWVGFRPPPSLTSPCSPHLGGTTNPRPPHLYASPAMRASSRCLAPQKPRDPGEGPPPLGTGGGGRGAGREQSPAQRLAGAGGFLLTLLPLAPAPPLPPPAPAGVSASQQLPGTGASRALEEPLLPLSPLCHQRKNLSG